MEDWKVEKVPVTLHLTPEAARTLLAYAGERNRGWFVSQLIMQQRRLDDLEGERLAKKAAAAAAPTKVHRKKRR